MAPFGKIYSYPGNPRTTAILAVAKANGLELEIVRTEVDKPQSADYMKLNPLGKVPTFVGADGFKIAECMAIAVYLTSQNEKTALLGKTKQDYASILRWMSFVNTEILTGAALGGWFRPLVGRSPYNKKNVEAAAALANKGMKILEDHLLVNTYLVSERLTLADLFCAGLVARGFENVFDKAWRAEFPCVSRWYETVGNQSIYRNVAGDVQFIDQAVKYTPPQKEKAPAKKEEAKPKPKAADDEEEDEAPKPKAKHPLEELGRPTFVLDEWKRQYSNLKETRGQAMPWFWKNANFEEFSLWQVDYKYNDELEMTFMSANLIGGFFARLEASRKYIFGVASVYGKTGDSIIKGAFYIRGQDAQPAFDVAPDYESFSFKKLDSTNPADKAFVEDIWTGDKDIESNGKTYEYADGKTFK